jgi:hypothetical protein
MATRRKDAEETGDAPRPGDGTASARLRDMEAATVVSRRGVLWRTGIATVAGAAALTALDERRADAATGGNFVLGNANSASSTTELSGTASPIMQLDGGGLGATGTTLVVNGPAGGAGLFVAGSSTVSTIGLAINGSGTGSATGVLGGSGSGTGVSGSSTSGTGIAGTSGTGVGVRGTSPSSAGVAGTSTSDAGVSGTSTSGAGVYGHSHSGTGVHASSATGNALSVSGKAHFSRSGSSSVSAQHSSKTVTVSGITSSSLVLVTLQSAISGVYVQSAVPASGHFTVHLNKTASQATKFAWFVLN